MTGRTQYRPCPLPRRTPRPGQSRPAVGHAHYLPSTLCCLPMRTRPAARTTVPCRMIASTAVTATGTATSTPVPEPSMSRFRNCGRAPCRTSAERSRSRAAAQGQGHVGSDRSCPRRRRPSPRAGRLGARATAARQGLRGPGRVVPASRPGGRRVRPDPRHRHGADADRPRLEHPQQLRAQHLRCMPRRTLDARRIEVNGRRTPGHRPRARHPIGPSHPAGRHQHPVNPPILAASPPGAKRGAPIRRGIALGEPAPFRRL